MKKSKLEIQDRTNRKGSGVEEESVQEGYLNSRYSGYLLVRWAAAGPWMLRAGLSVFFPPSVLNMFVFMSSRGRCD